MSRARRVTSPFGLLRGYRRLGVTFVSAEQALADPMYQLPEQIFTKGGPSWLWRVERARVVTFSDWFFADEEDRILKRFPPEAQQPGEPGRRADRKTRHENPDI